MAISYDTLDNALRKIKEECKSHESCKDCPFVYGFTNGCGILRDRPENWSLISEYRPVARLFKEEQ